MARQVATAAAMLGALLGFAGGALPQTPPANAPSTLAPVAPAAPATVTLPTPGMAGSLAFSAMNLPILRGRGRRAFREVWVRWTLQPYLMWCPHGGATGRDATQHVHL